MRLFHVSEEPHIIQFIPRTPLRNDIDKSKGLVWAIDEYHLPNFLTPRECPRVAYYASNETSEEDITRFFSSSCHHCITIEHAWYKRVRETTLYLYELDPANFYLQDKIGGYYVSEHLETPIRKIQIDDLFGELFKRNIEIRLLNNLWDFADAVKESTLNYSICDMALAQPRHDLST